MRKTSTAFKNAEDAGLQQPAIQVVVRPNPEALQWTKAFANVGLPANVSAYQDSLVTGNSTLLRLAAYTTGSVTTLYLNRVRAFAESTTTLTQWTSVVTSMMAGTRAALSTDGYTVRIWYITPQDAIVYIDSTNDGQTWSSPRSFQPGTRGPGGSYTLTALSSPQLNMLFTLSRRSSIDFGEPAQYLVLEAWQIVNGAWEQIEHPRGMTRVRTAAVTQPWDAIFQFDSCMITSDTACITLVDDLAGRPTSILFQNGFFSDVFAVEAIDFSEPERDEAIWLRLNKIGNKLILSCKRTQADTDFSATTQAVLYYSIDGMRWSEGYYVTEGSDADITVPHLWQSNLWLVGMRDLWKAPPTPLFGGATPTEQELDITESVLSVSIDEPEGDDSVGTVNVTLNNPYNQWIEHPLLARGQEIEVRGGFAGTEMVVLAQSRINKATPKVTLDESTVDITALDQRSAFKRGQLERALYFPHPLRRVATITSEDEMRQFAVGSGTWEFQASDGGYAQATKQSTNLLSISTALGGHLTASARMRLSNSFRPEPYLLDQNDPLSSRVMGSLVFSNNADSTSYYAVNFGRYVQRYSLVKVTKGDVRVLDRTPAEQAYAQNASGVYQYYPGVWVNRWFRLIVIQMQQNISVSIQFEDDANVFPILWGFDESPLINSGLVGVRAIRTEDKPTDSDPEQRWHTLHVHDLRVNGHEYETSVEEFLGEMAVGRGFDTVSVATRIDTPLQEPTGWTQASAGSGGTWSFSPLGLRYTDTRSNHNVRTGLRSDMYLENGIIDVEMKLGTTPTGSGRMGVLLRSDAPIMNYVAFSLDAGYDPTSLRDTASQLSLVVVKDGVLANYQYLSVPLRVFPNRITSFRFVFDGPWFFVYVNRLYAGAFYEPRGPAAGYIGLSQGLGVGGGESLISRFRVPWLDLGDLPIFKPGDTLDKAITSLLEQKKAWIDTLGRTIRLGSTLPQIAQDTLPNTALLGGGYDITDTDEASHCRVVSETPDGEEIVGTAINVARYRKTGIPVWRIEKVDGLRSPQECRDRAKQFLIDGERERRTRSYPTTLRYRYQKNDLLFVDNTLDDTSRTLYVSGVQRTFRRGSTAESFTPEMTIRLTEQNADDMQFASFIQT